MNYEIEYKFLVTNPDVIKNVTKYDDMKQGYFVTEKGISIRVRLKNKRAFLCIKGRVDSEKGHVRNEFEYEIPIEDGEFMIQNFCKNRIIEKRRYYIEIDEFTWEVDQFKGKYDGLIVAELEVPTLDTKFNKPDWVGLDVSSDVRYTNSYMANNL